MTSKIEQIKTNFFKVFIEWANGQYDLSAHSEHGQVLELKYDTLDAQPINTVITIGNQNVHRLFVPTNDTIISYDVTVKDSYSKGIPTFGDFDAYISLLSGQLTDMITETEFKPNLIYIIPAGQYYNLLTDSHARYYLTIRKRDKFTQNAFPSKVKVVDFDDK